MGELSSRLEFTANEIRRGREQELRVREQELLRIQKIQQEEEKRHALNARYGQEAQFAANKLLYEFSILVRGKMPQSSIEDGWLIRPFKEGTPMVMGIIVEPMGRLRTWTNQNRDDHMQPIGWDPVLQVKGIDLLPSFGDGYCGPGLPHVPDGDDVFNGRLLIDCLASVVKHHKLV